MHAYLISSPAKMTVWNSYLCSAHTKNNAWGTRLCSFLIINIRIRCIVSTLHASFEMSHAFYILVHKHVSCKHDLLHACTPYIVVSLTLSNSNADAQQLSVTVIVKILHGNRDIIYNASEVPQSSKHKTEGCMTATQHSESTGLLQQMIADLATTLA